MWYVLSESVDMCVYVRAKYTMGRAIQRSSGASRFAMLQSWGENELGLLEMDYAYPSVQEEEKRGDSHSDLGT